MTIFRNATEAELSVVLDWAAAEGWNPGLDDAAAFHSADPNGFFVALKDDTLVAAISVVNHNDHFAFLGLYIALPEVRGQGVGYGLWNHAIAHAGDRTIGLDGVPEQQENYASCGFVLARSTTRYAGRLVPEAANSVRPAKREDLEGLIAWEARVSGIEKPRYLKAWLADTACRKTLIDETDGDLSGFCTVRQCRHGAKIGPLLAKDVPAAERLMKAAASIFDEDLVIDVPESAMSLREVCERFALQPGFQTARMYRGTAPRVEGALFAVPTLELG